MTTTTASQPSYGGSSLDYVSARERLLAGLAAFSLGFGLLMGVGFAGPAAIHDAAHDTRHAIGFPCH